MKTEGNWTTAIKCTDTVGLDLSDMVASIAPNIGSVHIEWTDIINRDDAVYEIYRSPNNNWSVIGTDHEKIAVIASSRSATNEKMFYDDNDWDNSTGTILKGKTVLSGDAYSAQIAYYRIVGVDRFGNRFAMNEAKHKTLGPISSQWYQPSLPIDENMYILFPFDDGIGSTRGHYPENDDIPLVTLVDGKFGHALSIQTVPDNILEYAVNKLDDGDMENYGVSSWSPQYHCYAFDSGDYIECGNLGTLSSFSVVIFAYFGTYVNERCLWSCRGSNSAPYLTWYKTGAQHQLLLYKDGGSHTYTNISDPSGKWHTIMHTFSSSTVRSYLDGVLIDTDDNFTLSNLSFNPFTIGKGGYDPWGDKISRVIVFNVDLSNSSYDAFRDAIMCGIVPADVAPVADYAPWSIGLLYWYDISGNNKHGTNYGATATADQSLFLSKDTTVHYVGSQSLKISPGACCYQIVSGLELSSDYVLDFRYKAKVGEKLKVAVLQGCGAELITDGNMEAISAWTSYGNPDLNEKSISESYAGSKSTCLLTTGIGQGIRSNTFTTVTNGVYDVSFYIYPVDETSFGWALRKGDNSGWLFDENTQTLTANQWNRVNKIVTESAGGAGSYLVIYDKAGAAGLFYIDNVTVQRIDKEIRPTLVTVTGTGEWSNDFLVFRTSSYGSNVRIYVVPETTNSEAVYFDYSFCVKSTLKNGGMEGSYSSGIAPEWAGVGSGTPSKEESSVRDGFAAQKIISTNDYRIYQSIPVANFHLYLTKAKGKIGAEPSNALRVRDATDSVDLVQWGITAADYSPKMGLHVALSGNNHDIYFGMITGSSTGTYYGDSLAMIDLGTDINLSNRVPKYDAIYQTVNGVPQKGISVAGFTVDLMVKHAWDAQDGLEHVIFDTSGDSDTKNKFKLVKTTGNNLVFIVYSATADGYKSISYAVTNANFESDKWHRISIGFSAIDDSLIMCLNGYAVTGAGSGGIWADPTTWGDYYFIGGSSSGVPGDVVIDNVIIDNVKRREVEIITRYFVDTPFVDDGRKLIKANGVINKIEDHIESKAVGYDHLIKYIPNKNKMIDYV